MTERQQYETNTALRVFTEENIRFKQDNKRPYVFYIKGVTKPIKYNATSKWYYIDGEKFRGLNKCIEAIKELKKGK
jgi:hypothetical protein